MLASVPAGHVALQVKLGVLKLGLILGLGRLRKVERRAKRPRIDLRQHVAGFDVLAFGEGDLVELTVDPDLDRDGVEGLNGAEPGERDRDILSFGQADGGGDGLRSVARRMGRRRGRSAARQTPRHPASGNDQQRCNDQQPPPAHVILHGLCDDAKLGAAETIWLFWRRYAPQAP